MHDGTVNDYSGGENSPQQHVTISGSLWVASLAAVFAVLAFGMVLALCIVGPSLVDSRARSASASGTVYAQLAERETKLLSEKQQEMLDQYCTRFRLCVEIH